MRLLSEPLQAIAPDDIKQLWLDEASEGTELELKSDLPSKAGLQKDPWYQGNSFGEYARNQITEEIVAFANTLGGVLCVGIEESSDHPKRAIGPSPVPRVHELARRLRQAVYDSIDPPLPMLEAVGVELTTNGEGVVLLRVPPSRRRPHRHQVSKEVFVRRSDESARISMREIQELTLQATSEAQRVGATINDRRSKFRDQLNHWLYKRSARGCGIHLVTMPTTPLDLGRVVGRPALTSFSFGVVADFGGGNTIPCTWPSRPASVWRPGLRSISATVERPNRQGEYSLQTDGLAEVSFNMQVTDEQPGLFAGWLLGALGHMLAWIERIRIESGASVEFALAVQLPVVGRPIDLIRYGATSFSSFDSGGEMPAGENEFPIISVGSRDEFEILLQRFDEDVWNLAGQDIQKTSANFKFSGPN